VKAPDLNNESICGACSTAVACMRASAQHTSANSKVVELAKRVVLQAFWIGSRLYEAKRPTIPPRKKRTDGTQSRLAFWEGHKG
jgi:hypothetical protein